MCMQRERQREGVRDLKANSATGLSWLMHFHICYFFSIRYYSNQCKWMLIYAQQQKQSTLFINTLRSEASQAI